MPTGTLRNTGIGRFPLSVALSTAPQLHLVKDQEEWSQNFALSEAACVGKMGPTRQYQVSTDDTWLGLRLKPLRKCPETQDR